MSDFILYYDKLEEVANHSKSLGKLAKEYADDLESKIISGIGTVTGPSSGYLLSASDSVRDKINALEQKSEAFYQFAEQIIKLLEVAEQMDQEVADAITVQRGVLEHNKSLQLEDWKAKLINLLVDIKNDSPLLSTIADILGGMGAIHESLNDSIKHWYVAEGGKRKVKEALDKLETHSNVARGAATEIGVISLFNGKEFELFKNGPLSFSNLNNWKGNVNVDLKNNIKKIYSDGTGNEWTINSVKVISPVWQESDKKYSDMIQAKLLDLNFQWYFADSIDEQNQIVQQAKDIREKVDHGAGWWLDKAKQITEAAANEFSWFLGGSVSTNERDKWLEMNQMFQSDLKIKDDKTLAAGMFIAGMVTGSGEEKAAAKVVKSWIKHDTYNEVRSTLGKEGVEKFLKAMGKGFVGANKETGIKIIAGKGIKVGEQYYKYEIKVLGKGMSHYRILGNIDEKTGHIIFERLENLK